MAGSQKTSLNRLFLSELFWLTLFQCDGSEFFIIINKDAGLLLLLMNEAILV